MKTVEDFKLEGIFRRRDDKEHWVYITVEGEPLIFLVCTGSAVNKRNVRSFLNGWSLSDIRGFTQHHFENNWPVLESELPESIVRKIQQQRALHAL